MSLQGKEAVAAAVYLETHRSGRLAEKIRRGQRWLKRCTLCPRMCRVDRMAGEKGYCRTGRAAVVASYGPHYGEEQPLVGRRGSGTIFFSHCNLFCLFCQNFDISHGGAGTPVSAEQLAAMMLELQAQGCHNINFVTPTHVVVQLLEALPLAVEMGLKIPLVYNCGGYERVPALRLLDGVVDIYMPDFKFWEGQVAEELCAAPDYPERARLAVREMYRQAGDLQLDSAGVAERGLLVRHLVMPGGLAGTPAVMAFLATEISRNTYVNVMDQFHPCGRARKLPHLARRITSREFAEALDSARQAGLWRLDERHKHWLNLEF